MTSDTTHSTPSRPCPSKGPRSSSDERQRRLAEQLRANLARRKQQARARGEAGQAPDRSQDEG